MADTLSISQETLQQWRNDYDYTSGLLSEGTRQMKPVATDSDTDGWLDAFIRWLASLPEAVWGILLALFVAAVLFWVLTHTDWGKKRKKRENDDGEEENANEDIYAIDNYDSPLRQAELRGEWEEAVRLVYLATLRQLDETGRIRWEKHKAPMEYVEEAGSDELRPLTLIYLAVRFGHYKASEAMYREAVRLSEAIGQKGGGHA